MASYQFSLFFINQVNSLETQLSPIHPFITWDF